MKKIDMNTWERKEIYDFFFGVSDPFYMVSFVADVTELRLLRNGMAALLLRADLALLQSNVTGREFSVYLP